MHTVTVISGPGEGLSMDIDHELVIGREAADLTIDDQEISRRHVALRPVEKGVEVEDLDSLNGTSVNGRRISTALTLTTTGTVKVGTSVLRVEVELPQLTRESKAPGGELRESPLSQTDLTAPRHIVDTPRATPHDVTAPRPSPPQPAPQPAASVAAPPAPPAPAPPSAAAPSPPPSASPELRPQAQPPGLPPRPRGRGTTIALGVAGAFVLLVVVLLALANSGSSSSKRALTADLRTATVNSSPSDLLFAGVQSGSPTGNGAVTIDLHLRSGNARALKAPAKFTARVVHRFDGGSMTSVISGTATPKAGGSVSYTGTGHFTGGTKSFDGAKGRYRLNGTAGPPGTGTFTLEGRVEY